MSVSVVRLDFDFRLPNKYFHLPHPNRLWGPPIVLSGGQRGKTTNLQTNHLLIYQTFTKLKICELASSISLKYLVSFSGWGETESTWYVGHCFPIVPAPDDRWWWLWSSRWNEDLQGKPKYSEKTCPSATLSTTNPTWPGIEPGPPRWEFCHLNISSISPKYQQPFTYISAVCHLNISSLSLIYQQSVSKISATFHLNISSLSSTHQ
jgi:hypothetical protein